LTASYFSHHRIKNEVTPSHPTKIVVVCGPTGVGKTGFAIELARRLGGEIVGADSMQIYRRMDIGTAKPTAEERSQAVHHMVDIVDPDEDFDALVYAKRADRCIEQVTAGSKTPLVVGGTGLYIKALVHGLAEGAATDPQIRHKLQAELASLGAPAMHERLQVRDGAAAGRIHPNDGYRILRALEVLEITGRSMTYHHRSHGFSRLRHHALYIGLTMPREILYERINKRVDRMIAEGLVDEVRFLLDKGYDPELKSMQSLGYRHMVDYIQGRLTRDAAVHTLKRDHRHYAKRQMTWFGANPGMNWIRPDQHRDAVKLISAFL
jgi:tRNA dimethylallyltransferase